MAFHRIVPSSALLRFSRAGLWSGLEGMPPKQRGPPNATPTTRKPASSPSSRKGTPASGNRPASEGGSFRGKKEKAAASLDDDDPDFIDDGKPMSADEGTRVVVRKIWEYANEEQRAHLMRLATPLRLARGRDEGIEAPSQPKPSQDPPEPPPEPPPELAEPPPPPAALLAALAERRIGRKRLTLRVRDFRAREKAPALPPRA